MPLHTTVVLLGSEGCGKSSLVLRYVQDNFVDTYDPHVVDVYKKEHTVEGCNVVVDIIDPCGSDDFRSIRDVECARALGQLLCIDSTSLDSVAKAKELREDSIDSLGARPCVVVATKCDQSSQDSAITAARDLAAEWGVPFVESSAKLAFGVSDAFREIAFDTIEELVRPPPTPVESVPRTVSFVSTASASQRAKSPSHATESGDEASRPQDELDMSQLSRQSSRNSLRSSRTSLRSRNNSLKSSRTSSFKMSRDSQRASRRSFDASARDMKLMSTFSSLGISVRGDPDAPDTKRLSASDKQLRLSTLPAPLHPGVPPPPDEPSVQQDTPLLQPASPSLGSSGRVRAASHPPPPPSPPSPAAPAPPPDVLSVRTASFPSLLKTAASVPAVKQPAAETLPTAPALAPAAVPKEVPPPPAVPLPAPVAPGLARPAVLPERQASALSDTFIFTNTATVPQAPSELRHRSSSLIMSCDQQPSKQPRLLGEAAPVAPAVPPPSQSPPAPSASLLIGGGEFNELLGPSVSRTANFSPPEDTLRQPLLRSVEVSPVGLQDGKVKFTHIGTHDSLMSRVRNKVVSMRALTPLIPVTVRDDTDAPEDKPDIVGNQRRHSLMGGSMVYSHPSPSPSFAERDLLQLQEDDKEGVRGLPHASTPVVSPHVLEQDDYQEQKSPWLSRLLCCAK